MHLAYKLKWKIGFVLYSTDVSRLRLLSVADSGIMGREENNLGVIWGKKKTTIG